MRMEYILTYMLIEFLTLSSVNYFYAHFLTRYKLKNQKKFGIWGTALLLYALPNIIFKNWMYQLYCVPFVYALLLLLYEGKKQYRIMLAVSACILSLFSEVLTVILQMVIGTAAFSMNLAYMALNSLIYFTWIRLLCVKRKKNLIIKELGYYWCIVLIVPGGSIYILYHMMEWGAKYLSEAIGGHILVVSVILLSMNMLMFYLYDKLLLLYNESFLVESTNIYNKSLIEYLKQEQQNHSKLKKWKHDIKNYLLGLNILIRDGDYQEAQNMIADKIGKLADTEGVHYCNNRFVNAVLHNKLNNAKEHHISVTCDFGLIPENFIEYQDLAILIGNSVDNAVEACMRLEGTENRKIFISMRMEKNIFIYFISNSCVKTNSIINGIYFRTTKERPGEHGFGMDIMKGICEKYDGHMKAYIKDEIFNLEILMYLNG